MAARPIHGSALRLRRSRRCDLDRLHGLLGGRNEPRAERFDRRTLADPSQDVYVAETAAGEIVGVVAVAYVRSLRCGRQAAVLDTARAASGPDAALLEALLDFAEERARRRGCRSVRAWLGPDDGALRTALASRGWRVAESLEAALEIDR